MEVFDIEVIVSATLFVIIILMFGTATERSAEIEKITSLCKSNGMEYYFDDGDYCIKYLGDTFEKRAVIHVNTQYKVEAD